MDINKLKSTSITKFNVKGKTLYVKLLWKNNDTEVFQITIFDGNVTWSGKFSNELAKMYSNRCEETEYHYNKNLKRFLKPVGAIHNEVIYDFLKSQEHCNLATFAWKKRYDDSEREGSVYLVHGSVPVYLDADPESKELLLDFLLEENTELRTKIDDLNGKNEIISKDLVKCKTELEKFVDIKTSLEVSLYGKFVQLLNAKKRRIQVLEDNLTKFSNPNELSGDY